MDKKSKTLRAKEFFHKEQIIPVVWALVLMFVGFVGGNFWGLFEGPTEVIVRNADQMRTIHEPDTAPPVAQLDISDKEELAKLRDAILQLKEASENQADGSSKEREDYIAELEGRLESLSNEQRTAEERIKTLEGETKTDNSQETEPRSTEPADIPLNDMIAEWNRDRLIYRPKYELPKNVKGYRRYAPRYLSQAKCPNKQIWDSTYPKIGFQFKSIGYKELISPLIVKIARVDAPLKLYQVFAEQYHYEPGENEIELGVTLQPASYLLEFGYYVKSQVDEEYPKFYAFECEFDVIAESSD